MATTNKESFTSIMNKMSSVSSAAGEGLWCMLLAHPAGVRGRTPGCQHIKFSSVETLIMIAFSVLHVNYKCDFHLAFSFSTVFATQTSLKKSKLGTKISSSKSGNHCHFLGYIRPCSGSFNLQFILVDGNLLKSS